MAQDQDEAQVIAESLYKQNLELAIKNKTLSLLGKLYGISILTLPSKELASRITQAIQEEFSFERVSILAYDAEKDEVGALAYAESERFHTARAAANDIFDSFSVVTASKSDFLGPMLVSKKMSYTENLASVWGVRLHADVIAKIRAESHVRSVIAYPLVIGDRVIGFYLMTLNRTTEDLVDYEKESMQSFANVIAVSLDKAELYEALTLSNDKLAAANDRLKNLDQMKNEFLSIASHQLRAPITAIRGYAANIVEGDYGEISPGIREPLSVIQESTRLMVNSIEDYLNISRIEQGRMKYEKSDFDLADLANKVVNELAPIASKKGLSLTFAPSKPLIVHADIGKMKQVVTNLMDNAVKYTEKGSVAVSAEQSGSKAVITIADTGIGIAPEEIGQLFSKFTRAREANKVNTTGTGLGLYVAKQLIEGNGGIVRIESDGLGKGSRFIVEQPLKA